MKHSLHKPDHMLTRTNHLVWIFSLSGDISSNLVSAGWVFDSASGYYHDKSTGLYYDSNSGFYYSDSLGNFICNVMSCSPVWIFSFHIYCILMFMFVNEQASGLLKKRRTSLCKLPKQTLVNPQLHKQKLLLQKWLFLLLKEVQLQVGSNCLIFGNGLPGPCLFFCGDYMCLLYQ